jgi:CRP-like cAMP-binding protein
VTPAGSPSSNREDLRALLECSLPHSQPETREALVDTVRVRTISVDEVVWRQGEVVPLTMFVRGYGAFRRTTVDGQQLTTGICEPGDLYGFTSIASVPAPVDLIALTECEVATWRGADLRRLATIDSGLALDAIDRLSTFTAGTSERVDGFVHQGGRRRVVRVLARYRELFFAEPAILSRSHLPSLVGTSREMTGRVLRELEREGTLERVGRNGLRLLRPDLLDADARPTLEHG